MKKRIFVIAFLVVVTGISAILGFTQPQKEIKQNGNIEEKEAEETIEKEIMEETTKKSIEITAEKETVEKVEEKIEEAKETSVEETLVLSAEDKAVKAEIAKYSDTNVDFRFEKKEKFEGKEYSFKFSRMGCISSESLTSNITYVSDNGDEVSYDLGTGRMTMVYFHSLESQKGANSIDITQAEKTAYDYAAKNCDIAQYVLEEKEERDNGYMISYCKQICGYRTKDRVRVLVGFDGSIVWTTIRLNAIDDKLNVDKSWFEERIKELENPNYDTTIEDAWIERDEDKVYFCVKNKAKNLTTNHVSASIQRFEIK